MTPRARVSPRALTRAKGKGKSDNDDDDPKGKGRPKSADKGKGQSDSDDDDDDPKGKGKSDLAAAPWRNQHHPMPPRTPPPAHLFDSKGKSDRDDDDPKGKGKDKGKIKGKGQVRGGWITRCIDLAQTVSSDRWDSAIDAASSVLALHSRQDATGAGGWRRKATAIAVAVINENRAGARRLSAELQQPRPPPS
ncbi:hypothetical protein N9L68_02865 [bacterium]|nr:hypothetical protein [bacterium]